MAFNHLRTDDVYIRACKLLPKRRMTYIYARKHFFLKSIPSGTLRARHGENRPQVVKKERDENIVQYRWDEAENDFVLIGKNNRKYLKTCNQLPGIRTIDWW